VVDEDAARRTVFDATLLEACEGWKSIGYHATRFRQMLARHGGVETARRLLRLRGISPGFERLRDANRLEETVEFIVLRPEFASLFTADELGVARQRLVDNGLAAGRLS
jgi:hypothetical protein